MYRNQSSTLQRVLIVALIYAVNVTLAALCYWRVGDMIADFLVARGYPSVYWMNGFIQSTIAGLIYGQLGCVALWFHLSGAKLETRIGAYVLLNLQITLMFVLISAEHGKADQAASAFFVFLAIAIGLLVVNGIALYLSNGRARLVRATEAQTHMALRGITISQTILATTTIAIALAAVSASRLAATPNYWLVPVYMVCVFGLLPMAGLLIGTSFKNIGLQLVVCLTIAAGVVVAIDFKGQTEIVDFLVQCTVVSLIVLVPVMWVRIVRKFGYVIECKDKRGHEARDSSAVIFDDACEVAKP